MKLNILCLCLIISFSNEFSSPEMKLDIKAESEIEKLLITLLLRLKKIFFLFLCNVIL